MARIAARNLFVLGSAAALLALAVSAPAQNTAPRTGWLWHLHQPIYWNDQNRNAANGDRVEYAWESIAYKDANPGAHPYDNLRDIFGIDDRRAAYQSRPLDSIGTVGSLPNAGAQLTYSGALAENVGSLGQAGQLGYSGGWKNFLRSGWDWKTSSGKPRLDSVNFSFHHALLALHDPQTVYMEVKLHQEKMKQVLGSGYTVSRGIFPTEMCYSTRLIPVLKQLGIEWSIVSGEHIARACPDFPLQFGSGGVNCAPPNKADQINPNGEQFIRVSIDRGCSRSRRIRFPTSRPTRSG
jgi:hypothetical protein